MAAVFAQLNQGEGVTAGLKKVKKGEGLADKPVVPKEKAPAPAAPKPATAPAKPPKFALNGNKWEVEYQNKATDLKITEPSVKNTVYIYKCVDSIVQVEDKVNSIALDGCKKTAVVFNSAVSGVELVNCVSCKVQVLKKVSTVTVDKCDGLQIILSRESLGAEIVSAKSSELNIVVPGETDDDEFKEHPIPEQFVSKYVDGKWITECMAHTG